jgi:hypothetical protein
VADAWAQAHAVQQRRHALSTSRSAAKNGQAEYCRLFVRPARLLEFRQGCMPAPAIKRMRLANAASFQPLPQRGLTNPGV